ncbi:hypothetical protein F0562_010445 [Nyssa sinensis]|uniref:Glycosyltransferase n=1 Tax=Nyssa sinensis TaxID=561372 RepID=A0A5J5A1R0_9ASTE|nr:hypothetical protein F0562_010445 [Nyssa sinensis]
MVPYPAQGHVTPMLQLASAFLNLGFEPVVITPDFIHSRIASQIDPNHEISCMSIPDGLDQGTAPPDFFAIEMAMENNMPLHLERLVGKFLDHEDEDGGVACMVVDLLASWAINVANRCGVQVAGFWPAMLASYQLIAAIPDMLRSGIISETGDPQHQGPICYLPGQPVLCTEDLPWLIGTVTARSSRFKFWSRTLERSITLGCLLVNSFPEELTGQDNEKQDQLNGGRIFRVGPLSKHAESKINGSFWEEDMSCLDWLEKQSPGSVVYVSFGSWVRPIGEAKMKKLALALEASKRPFIWVQGCGWREELPVGYLERMWKQQQGKIVSWAPQKKVLEHEGVGCYLTHCGWNSTMEAIQWKKPLLCYPVAGDQFINCAYIVKEWRIGLKINEFGQKDVEQGMKGVMEDSEMSERLIRLNERIMGNEASSRVMANLTAFIDHLQSFPITT